VIDLKGHMAEKKEKKPAVTRLSVSVKAPATTDEVSIRQLENWQAARSPHDTLLKGRVRELLDAI
jgi:hypothetical protein